MFECPVCSGAFSWKEDMLHHFGAVHHLEELVAHLEAEFRDKTCPSYCRVPWSLFKHLLPKPAASTPPSQRDSAAILGAPKNKLSTTECSDTGSPVRKTRRSSGSQTRRSKERESVDSDQSTPRGLNDIHVEQIERYHCEFCEFSANDFGELERHVSEHSPQNAATLGGLLAACAEDTSNDCSSVPATEQVDDRYFCTHCPYSSKSKRNFVKHMASHKRSALVTVGYRCAYCNMANVMRGSVCIHQSVCHRDQPRRIIRIDGGEVLQDSNDVASVSETVQSNSTLPSSSVSKKKTKLSASKSELTAVKSASSTSEKTVTMEHPKLPSPLPTRETTIGDEEGLAESLESQLPQQMIYPAPVACPQCDFCSRARVNLVRHIRLAHGDQNQSEKRASKLSSFFSRNRGSMDPDNSEVRA